MKTFLGLAMAALLAFPLVAKEPAGTVPRSSALDYPAHAMANGAAMGARVLTAKEVRQAFSTDLNKCCLVVEVAIYPAKAEPVNVSLNGFALQVGNTYQAVKASGARLLAAQLQQRNEAPARQAGTDVTVYPEVHVGYVSRTNTRNGRHTSAMSYGVGAAIAAGIDICRP